MKIIKKKSKSFTLVELLIAMVMGILIITAGYSVYIMSIKSYRSNTASAELTQNARISLERISRDIRQNVEILTPLPADPSAGTPPSELKFQDGHNFWLPTNQIQYITYSLSGTDLHRKLSHFTFSACPGDSSNWVLWSTKDADNHSPNECEDQDVIKAQSVSALQFWGSKVITISLSVADEKSTYQFETKSLGRNIQ